VCCAFLLHCWGFDSQAERIAAADHIKEERCNAQCLAAPGMDGTSIGNIPVLLSLT
jgi:hypothetical protein